MGGRLTRTRPEEEDGSQGPYPPLHHRTLRLLHEEVKVVGPQVKEDRIHAQELQANFRLNLILPPPTPYGTIEHLLHRQPNFHRDSVPSPTPEKPSKRIKF